MKWQDRMGWLVTHSDNAQDGPATQLLRMESINRDGSEVKQAEFVGQPYMLESMRGTWLH